MSSPFDIAQKYLIGASEESPAAIEKRDSLVNMQSILAEHDEGDILRIMEVWRRLFGFSESREHIETSLRNIRRWQHRMKDDRE